jgi:hypothetical protein
MGKTMTDSNPKTILTLKQQIAVARQRLQNLYDARGCTDSDVLAASIELDELVNHYYQMNSEFLSSEEV